MSRDTAHLLDILEAARLAGSYVEGKTEAEFLADTLAQDAVIRRLEIIGEAARRLSDEGFIVSLFISHSPSTPSPPHKSPSA
ncbi:MAG: DUF86 domain-containing protein [Chloroflexi bacterium]|nr:DUF86 domain-containing protein [Chloroflexota bacterium]